MSAKYTKEDYLAAKGRMAGGSTSPEDMAIVPNIWDLRRLDCQTSLNHPSSGLNSDSAFHT